jgi:excisionase family DNA binding protein
LTASPDDPYPAGARASSSAPRFSRIRRCDDRLVARRFTLVSRRTDQRPTGDEWLALGEASRLLGVNADSLRRWADEGRIDVFTTPGGHRRFARRSLDRLIVASRTTTETTRPTRPTLARLGATPGRVSAAYRRSYVRPHDGGQIASAAMGDNDRQAFRRDGRRLVGVLLAYLDAGVPAERSALADEATEIVEHQARRLAVSGVPVGESLALFVAARRPFLVEIGAVARRRGLAPDQLTILYEDAAGLLDRLLLRFVDAHHATPLRRPVGPAGAPRAR